MSKSTIKDLPEDIRKAVPHFEQNSIIKEIIKQAELGEFHDYKNKRYVCGKVQLVGMLYDANESNLLPIIDAVVAGDYDELPDEEDEAMLIKDWVENGGSEESYKKIFGDISEIKRDGKTI